MSNQTHPDLEKYRSYLRTLADMDLNPRLRAKEDVSDVVQVTLMQAHQDFEAFRGSSEAELRGWLKGILSHKLANVGKHYTREKRDHRREINVTLNNSAALIVGQLSADQTSPSQNVIRQERAEQLADAMADLLKDERTALTMMYVHASKVDEIAEYLGRSSVAVAGLLRRGKSKLRKAMQQSSSDA